MRWTELYRCVFDAAMVLWFFKPIKPAKTRKIWQRVLCFLMLFCTAPVYVVAGTNSVIQVLVRFAARTLVYVVWLYLEKGTNIHKSLYMGLLCWIAFTTENNIFLAPQLSVFRWSRVAYTPFSLVNYVVDNFIELLLEFLLLTIISRTLPLTDKRTIGWQRFVMAITTVVCQLYIKDTLKTISEALPEHYIKELTIYPIALQILLTTALVLLERSLAFHAQRERERMNEIAIQYRYENARSKEETAMDVRRLHHDLKNHLLGLRQLAGDNEKLDGYIDQMLKRTEEYEMEVETGNTMLNGLLSEKLSMARQRDIAMSACIDFRAGAFLSDMDICAIFGNALDNAIEASDKVFDHAKRSILVKCASTDDNLIISFLNYYESEQPRRGYRLQSDKNGPGHGLGLSSIKSTVQRYGGAIHADTDDFHNFVLTVVIPRPKSNSPSI